MLRVAPVLLTLLLATLPTGVWAQCQTQALALQTDQQGTLDASDCSVDPNRSAPGEYWTFSATAGDIMIVTMRRGTMLDPYLIILDASNRIVATDDDSLGNLNARAAFTASATGVYRVVATTFHRLPTTDFGTYTIRVERVTTPLAPNLFTPSVSGTTVTVFWQAPISAGPILEYVMEVATAPGAQNIGVFSVGTVTQIVASAVAGTYFVRVRARNAFGFGPFSVEQTVTVGTGAPSAPRFLTASIAARRVTLTWAPPVTGPVTTYQIQVGSSPGAANLGVFGVGTRTSLVVDGIAPGVYYVRVHAVNAVGTGPPSNEVVIFIF